MSHHATMGLRTNTSTIWGARVFTFAVALGLGPGCFGVPESESDDASAGEGGAADSSSATDGGGGSGQDSGSSPGDSTAGSSAGGDPDDSGGSTSGTVDDTEGAASTGEVEPEPEPLVVCPVYFDEFDDDVTDPRWILPYPDSIEEIDGQAVIHVTAAEGDEFPRMMLQPEQGGLQGARARLHAVELPSRHGMNMMLWVHSVGETRITWSITQDGPNDLLQARITDEAGDSATVHEQLREAQQWLQLREEAGTLFFEASADGAQFEVIHEMPTPFDVSSALVGYAGSNFDPLPNDEQVAIEQFYFECAR